MSKGSSCGLMSLNCNKAGMVGIDKEKINQVIEAASKGSKFYAKKQADQARIDSQAEDMRQAMYSLTDKQLEKAKKEADRVVAQLRTERDLSRTIVHVDMDMFYAAVEMRDNPKLANIPMAVGGMGMLSTSNYLARKYGVRAAMPGFIAKKLCPELVIVPGNMEKYAEVADVIRGVFKEYDPNFAPMSLDEAYLDISNKLGDEDSNVTAWDLVNEMRAKICERTSLTASAGIAPNCLLAKVCSDMNKPNGQYQLSPNPSDILDFISTLPIRKVGGIGNVSEQILKAVGVQTCGDLYLKRAEISLLFSEGSSQFYLAVSQGIGSTKIEPPEERERKSISTETTFRASSDRETLLQILTELCQDLSKDCKAKTITGQAVTVKIKSHDFKLKTKVSQMCEFSNNEELIFATAKKILISLLDSSEEQPPSLRLMGVRLSELKDEDDPSLKQKQGNLLAFARGDSSNTQKVINRSKEMLCPMCGFAAENLAKLNTHLDQCLSVVTSANLETGSSTTVLQDDQEHVCPICGYTASTLGRLNEHIDDCVSNTPVKTSVQGMKSPTPKGHFVDEGNKSDDDMFRESDDDIGASQNVGTVKDFVANVDPKHKSLNVDTEKSLKVNPTSFFKKKLSESKEITKTEESPVLEPPSPKRNSQLSCPVCFDSGMFQTEEQLGNHIEECLSKQEIAKIMKSEKTASNQGIEARQTKKRKSEEMIGRVCKKWNTGSSSKIDSYFKPKLANM